MKQEEEIRRAGDRDLRVGKQGGEGSGEGARELLLHRLLTLPCQRSFLPLTKGAKH